MVLRRLPVSFLLMLLALAAPTAARAQSPAPGTTAPGAYDDGGGTYDDGGAYADDDGGQWYDDGATGGQAPAGIPVPATTVPATPIPAPAPIPAAPVLPTVPVTRTIAGTVARLRTDGKAAIPRGAPQRVQALIAAANRIVGKPYKWGGGHAHLSDAGYDCSGAVSYALIGAQLLAAPLVSGTLARWQSGGAGRWVSVYANKGHVYLEVAGLRLDTSPVGDATGRSGVRWRPPIGKRRGFSTRHPIGF